MDENRIEELSLEEDTIEFDETWEYSWLKDIDVRKKSFIKGLSKRQTVLQKTMPDFEDFFETEKDTPLDDRDLYPWVDA